MILTLVRGRSPYPVPRAAVLVGALVVALGITAAALPGLENGPVACPFRAVTGLPCLTCGLTRATHWLIRGDVPRAFGINPLVTAVLLAALPLFSVLWVANRAGGVAVRVSMSATERRVAWTLLAVVALANWTYVLLTHR